MSASQDAAAEPRARLMSGRIMRFPGNKTSHLNRSRATPQPMNDCSWHAFVS